jgi:acetyl-CoA synthetase
MTQAPREPLAALTGATDLNIGVACSDLQCQLGRGDKVAMRWLASGNQRQDVTFADLARESTRFAGVLASLGVGPGERGFILLPKSPETFYAFLGMLKARVVAGTLFFHFGEQALLDRLGDSEARVLLVREAELKKVQRIRDRLPNLRHVLVVDARDHRADGTLSYGRLMRETRADFAVPPTPSGTPSVLHYTSGSTGKPKGVLHTHGSLIHQARTTAAILDVRADDVYWCTADPGWVTGTSYGIIGPWALGTTQVHDGGGFDANAWMAVLEREAVNVWYTAPTALRMLMREDPGLYRGRRLQALRHVASVGEPLNPEIIQWGRRVLGKDIHDTWFQTETGGIMIANRAGLPIKPGSMGRPVDDVDAAILDKAGQPLPAGQQGRLCLRAGWPSMFVAYLHHAEAYASRFADGFYDSGDTAFCDADGYYWFVGRADDVINTSGHLVGPFEIESALLELPEVVDVAAIAAPDPIRHQKVVAFVVLRQGVAASRELDSRIRMYLATRLSAFACPQEVVFAADIPKNRSGKILRRVLRARYLGQDVGDISTMEPGNDETAP